MKYKILEWLFSWTYRPILSLSFIDLFIILAELIILVFTIQGLYKIWRKVIRK